MGKPWEKPNQGNNGKMEGTKKKVKLKNYWKRKKFLNNFKEKNN